MQHTFDNREERDKMNYFNSAHGEVSWNDMIGAVMIELKGFSYGTEMQSMMLSGIGLLK